jgi:acyl-CoA synthetase (AMP-forming)/AMP-acid ligase II
MNIAETLRLRSSKLGDAPALIDVYRGKDRTYSFRDFDQATATVAGQLKAAGLQEGDGVLILHPVAIELYLILVGLFRIGCVAVFLDPSAGRAHIERCCSIFPPKAFFGSVKAQMLRLAVPAIRRVPLALCPSWFPGTLKIAPGREVMNDCSIAALSDKTPALVTFTSGSTGEPKAALRTHGFLLAQHQVLERSLELRPGGRDLTTLPVFVLANLGSGVTSILPNADLRSPGKIDPKPVIGQIQRHSIMTTAASPAFMSRILSGCEKTGRQLPELERVYLGGAPVFPGLLRKTKEICSNATVTAVYGSTEAEPMAEIALHEIAEQDFQFMREGRGLLAGRPVSEITLQVIQDLWGTPLGSLGREQFRQMTLASGEPGEIVVSGPHVLQGYLRGIGDAETKFDVDGTRWHRTGDLGYVDASGRLWLLGRAAAKIQDEGGTLYPFAVECAAMELPSVRRTAVISMSGQRVLAVECEVPECLTDIDRSLAWAKLDQVIALDHLPVDKRHNAKIDYVALKTELTKRVFPHQTFVSSSQR